jgi:putative iron-dependent peroxidase
LPPLARYLSFTLHEGADPLPDLQALAAQCDGERLVAGLGLDLVDRLGATVPGLRHFEATPGAKMRLPATPGALWLWLRGEDRGELLHRSRTLCQLLAPAFAPQHITDAFLHAGGRDLSGYEDGTENPTGDAALAAAFVPAEAGTLAGSSFVAVQRWRHNLPKFDAMTRAQQDACIGRERDSNEEMDDAPASAHVKRTAQEDFEPEAFVLRRSMPWTEGNEGGLVFVAFGHSFDAFEAQLRRMSGAEDGITDALFRFTQPEPGAYFWCPPVRAGRLDLGALGL